MDAWFDRYAHDIKRAARDRDWSNSGSFMDTLAVYQRQGQASSRTSHHGHGDSDTKSTGRKSTERKNRSKHHSKARPLPSESNPGQVPPSHGPAVPSAPTEDPRFRRDPRMEAALAQAASQAQSQDSTARASALRTYPTPGSTYPSRGPPAATTFTNGPASTVKTDAQLTGRHFPNYAQSQYRRFPTQCTDSAAAPGYDAAEDWVEESSDEAEE